MEREGAQAAAKNWARCTLHDTCRTKRAHGLFQTITKLEADFERELDIKGFTHTDTRCTGIVARRGKAAK